MSTSKVLNYDFEESKSRKIRRSQKSIVSVHTVPDICQVPSEKGIPKFEFPEEGMSPRAAYQLIHNELSLDGNPFLNLASFVNTWMEPEAEKLIMENINKNHHRCL